YELSQQVVVLVVNACNVCSLKRVLLLLRLAYTGLISSDRASPSNGRHPDARVSGLSQKGGSSKELSDEPPDEPTGPSLSHGSSLALGRPPPPPPKPPPPPPEKPLPPRWVRVTLALA